MQYFLWLFDCENNKTELHLYCNNRLVIDGLMITEQLKSKIFQTSKLKHTDKQECGKLMFKFEISKELYHEIKQN